MIEENKFRPFLIGIVDGSLENQITKQLLSKLEGYQICSIYMSNYLIDGAENESVPELIDFELLEDHLLKLLNNEECSIPIYDFKNKKRSNETKKIESCQIIILDGLLCFHDSSIRNFLDLKIFIDTDNDTRYAETICKEIEKNNNLIEISQNYFDKIKPSHNNFIITKKFADLVLPNETGHQTAIDLIMNYLKLLLDRVNNNQKGNIFFFINEIIDAKYKFCEDNLILKKEKTTIDFLRAIFEDFIKQREDEEFVGVIRKTLIEMLESLLVDYLQKFTTEIKLVFDSDDISNYDFNHCPTVFYFKTAILTQEDIEKPQYILSQNKNCNIIICSIFLAPRFAHLIIGKQINSILFATLYFSEFFVKYEKIIKGDKLVFNEKELEKIVKQMLSEYI